MFFSKKIMLTLSRHPSGTVKYVFEPNMHTLNTAPFGQILIPKLSMYMTYEEWQERYANVISRLVMTFGMHIIEPLKRSGLTVKQDEMIDSFVRYLYQTFDGVSLRRW